MQQSKMSITLTGLKSERDYKSFKKGIIGLLKHFGGEGLRVKTHTTIFCNDCKETFFTFRGLQIHLKNTGHKDVAQ